MGLREIQVLLERDFGRDCTIVKREKKMVLFNFDGVVWAGLVGGSISWVGSTCWLASEEECAEMALISPFELTYRTVTRVPIYQGDRFVNFDRIVGIKEPLLIVHGTVEKAIPPAHGKSLFGLSFSVEKEFLSINRGRHNDLPIVASNKIFAALDRLAARRNEESYLFSRIAWSS